MPSQKSEHRIKMVIVTGSRYYGEYNESGNPELPIKAIKLGCKQRHNVQQKERRVFMIGSLNGRCSKI